MQIAVKHFELSNAPTRRQSLRYAEELDMWRQCTSGSSVYLKARRRDSRAFTLIELMISIALVLLLILGVNQVFTYTTQAVGSGEAINAAIRSSRAVQATFAGDFNGIVHNGPGVNDAGCIIISSRAYYAYKDAKDQASQGKIKNDATMVLPNAPNAAFTDINGDGTSGDSTVPGEIVYPSTYNFRNHRLDTLSFFSRGLFPRQTGNPGIMVQNMATTEAWIWYGHLHLPDNRGQAYPQSFPNVGNNSGASANSTTNSTFPCMGTNATNPNNYFGSQLVLGRVAMLLSNCGTKQPMPDNNNNNQAYYDGGGGLGATCQIGSSYDNWSTGIEPFTDYYFPSSRLDIANASIATVKAILSPAPPSYYWDYLMDGNQSPAAALNMTAGKYARFECNPFVAKPMASKDMAFASPYFLGGCSQFIVEFAGNFLTQDDDPSHTLPPSATSRTRTNYGDVMGLGPDPTGKLDFTVTYPNYTSANPGLPFKQIKWYGMPRSTTGNSTIFGPSASPSTPNQGDVVPVRDWLQAIYKSDGTLASPSYYAQDTFEQVGPPVAEMGNYGSGNMTPTIANTGYTCAFGPTDPHPSLIRITLTLDDPTGRLQQGQTYQYIFAVP